MTKSSLSAPDVEDLTLSEGDRRELIAWAEQCLRRLLPIFARHRPDDSRLEHALDAIADFRAGDLAVGPMRKKAFSCHDAARDCEDPAASAVARACGQAIAIAHMGGHARNIARYTRKALSGRALTDELEWQRSQLPTRFDTYVYPE
jgi:hypothetical protein